MSSSGQADELFTLTTPLGVGALLPVSLSGHEAVSQLFSFEIQALSPATPAIDFEHLIGRSVTVTLHHTASGPRWFNGIIRRLTEGVSDGIYTRYRLEIVPKLWLLTKVVRCRIFQHISVPDILRAILSELDVIYVLYETYHPRDYVVQYCESDFNFLSRLMEDEGISYYFSHAESSHQIIVSDRMIRNRKIAAEGKIVYGGEGNDPHGDFRVLTWEKTQELRSGVFSVRDHNFELPTNTLDSKVATIAAVEAGSVSHKLRVGGNHTLDLYEFPGGYAKRYDSVGRSGETQAAAMGQVLADRDRVVRLRMEEEESASLTIQGTSNCGHFMPGFEFDLDRHVNADGAYLLTHVKHAATNSDRRSSGGPGSTYENRFACIPVGLSLRPPRQSAKPVIAGVQTATVVGPAGDELFCDRYGRVKVQFHWDRDGKKDINSSCWLRVSQVWAGAGWGAFFWPRIGHEVVVAFENGDPDCPLIIGSVYNAANMPPYEMPSQQLLGGIRSNSPHSSARQHFNSIVFNDEKGAEHLAIHSEHNLSLNSEYDKMIRTGRHKGEQVANSSISSVGTFPGVGGGSGGGMDDGNTVAPPQPVNFAPGLNAIWVIGENMQGALGLNHQVALGTNQQICIDPVGLLATVADTTPLTGGILGGSSGNIQVAVGTTANVTMGQAYQFNIGATPGKFSDGAASSVNTITNDVGYGEHKTSTVALSLLSAVVIAYAAAYAQLVDGNDFVGCGTATLTYQLAVDALLELIMISETIQFNVKKVSGVAATVLYAAIGADGAWEFSLVAGLGPTLAATIASTLKNPRIKSE